MLSLRTLIPKDEVLAKTQSYETPFQGWHSPAGGSMAGSKMATSAEEA